jgi:hypothetical protein
MPFEVIFDESGNEEISMIITSLESEFKRIVSLITGFSKGFTSQFIGVPHITSTLIDQNGNLRSIVTLDQFGGIVFLSCFNTPQISLESNLTPRSLSGVSNRSESRNRLVHAGVLQEQGEGTVTSHTVASDTNSSSVNREEGVDQFREFLGDIGVHVVVLLIFISGGVNVETGARTETESVVLAFDFNASGGGIGEDDSEAVLGGELSEATLNKTILISAGQTGQEVEDRGKRGASLGRFGEVDGEGHFALSGVTPVLQSLDITAVTLHVGVDVDLGSLNGFSFVDDNDSTNAVTRVESVNGFVDLFETLDDVGDVGIEGSFTSHDLSDELRNFSSALPATESGTFPVTTSNELEGTSGDFLASSGDTDDARFTETSVAKLKSVSHDLDVTSTVESVVETPLFLAKKVVLDVGVLEFKRVDTFVTTELFS